jgi:two-component system sensor histidine kinase ChiS
MVEDIHQSSMRLIDIVNDFLDVSRIEQGKISFTYENVELDKVIETTIYEMRAVLQEKHLSLDFNKETLGELPMVWADKNRLKQIIYNMVGNAAKFTDQGGITINASADGDTVKILVVDTGRGISSDNQRLLFHKFQQAGGSLLTRDTTRGTGLGLYISKMLIENMGGHMALESSTEGKGSTFSVTIPIATGKQAAASKQSLATTDSKTGLTHVETVSLAASTLVKPAAAKIGGKPGRLLIVEDDPYVLRMYARIFDAELLTIKTALNGRLGIVAAQSFQPDLILLDVMMPVMNGIEALDALKADPATKKIPVIMLSSFGEEDTVHQALSKGAEAYLIKSDFTPEQLQQEIKKRLNTARDNGE